MKCSNTNCRFVPTGFKENRSVFWQKVDDSQISITPGAVEVDGKEGFYVEKPSLLDKYLRRCCAGNPHLKQLTYLQFAQRYISCKKIPSKHLESLKKSLLTVQSTHTE